MRAMWDDKQCFRPAISTCFTQKSTFHFSSANSKAFCEAATGSVVQNGTDTFISQSRHHFMYKNQKVSISELSTIFGKLNGFVLIQLEMDKI